MVDRQKIRRVIFGLLSTEPFLGHVLSMAEYKFDESLDAPMGMTITEQASLVLIANPKMMEEFSLNEQTFILVHEIMHFLLQHPVRAKAFPNVSTEILNIAMDLAVNSLLRDGFTMSLPHKGLHPREFNFPPLLTFEKYISLLSQQAVEIAVNARLRHCWNVETSVLNAIGLAQRIYSGAKRSGANPAGKLRDLYEGYARVDWQDELNNVAQSFETSDDWMYKKRKISRRYAKPPGSVHEFLGTLHVIIDTSGSISGEMLGQFFSVLEQLATKYEIWVHEVDADLQRSYIYEGKGAPTKVKGGGGTAIMTALNKINEQFGARNVILFTDGYVCDWSNDLPPNYERFIAVLPPDGNKNLPVWVDKVIMQH